MGSANMPLSPAGPKNPGSAPPRCPRSADGLEGLGRRKPSASKVPEVGLGSETSILPGKSCVHLSFATRAHPRAPGMQTPAGVTVDSGAGWVLHRAEGQAGLRSSPCLMAKSSRGKNLCLSRGWVPPSNSASGTSRPPTSRGTSTARLSTEISYLMRRWGAWKGGTRHRAGWTGIPGASRAGGKDMAGTVWGGDPSNPPTCLWIYKPVGALPEPQGREEAL